MLKLLILQITNMPGKHNRFMADIIWGNGSKVLSNSSFSLNVTHRKDGNKQNYADSEKIQIVSGDLPGLPYDQKDWDEEILRNCVVDTFLKCEIEQRDQAGTLLAKVSHSGVGGY